MLAAENGALPGGKVGGIGDVLRDLPLALAGRGWRPTVLTPSYGLFSTLPGAEPHSGVTLRFAGRETTAGRLFAEAETVIEEFVGPDHPFVAINLDEWALLLRKTGETAKAEELEARSRAIKGEGGTD